MPDWLDKIAPYGPYVALVAALVLAGAVFLQSRHADNQAERLRKQNDELSKDFRQKTNEVATLQKELLNYQTGGDGYPVVRMKHADSDAPRMEVIVSTYSRYPLPDVRIFVTDETDATPIPPLDPSRTSAEEVMQYMMSAMDQRKRQTETLSYGPQTLGVTDDRVIGTLKARSSEHLRYVVRSQARMRFFYQQLSYRLKDGHWLEASRVYGDKLVKLYENISVGYPVDAEGEPLW